MTIHTSRIKMLIVLSFVSSCCTFVTPLITPLLIIYLNLNEQKASFVMAGIFMLTGLVQPFIGILIDRQYYRTTAIFSTALFSMGLFMMMFHIHSASFFIVGVISIILGLKMIHLSLNTCLMKGLDGNKKGEVYLWHYLAFNLGFFCASILAYQFIEQYRLYLFVMDGLTTLTVAYVCYFILKRDQVKTGSNDGKLKKTYYLLLKHRRRFLGLSLIWVLIFSHSLVVPLVYNYLGMDPLKWTLYLMAMNTLGAVVLGLISKKILERVSEKICFVLGCVFLATGYMLIPWYTSLIGITLCTLAIIFGEVLLVAPQTNLLYRCFSEKNIGLASGMNSLISSLGKFLCPFLSFILFANTLNIQFMFSLFFGLAIPLLICFSLWPYLQSNRISKT